MYLYLCASIFYCLCVCVCSLFLLPFPPSLLPFLLPVLCLAEFYYCRDGKFKLEFTNGNGNKSDTENANETL